MVQVLPQDLSILLAVQRMSVIGHPSTLAAIHIYSSNMLGFMDLYKLLTSNITTTALRFMTYDEGCDKTIEQVMILQ